MTRIIDCKRGRRLSGRLAAGLAISAFLTLGMLVAPASADDHRGDRRGGDHRDDHRGGWGGGYYAAPPVVYAAPYYAPPVVYSPGINIGIGIR